jgi:hypothetical protein
MHLPQLKVLDRKTIINVPILCGTKEFDQYSEINSLTASGETFKSTSSTSSKYNLASVHAWVNIDQLQADGIITKLGFGRWETELSEKNGIHYTMKIDETGEGKYVKGKITYNIVAVEVNGKKYTVKNDHKLPNGTEMQTSFEMTYNGKSAKNSTLFGFLRRIIYNGLLQFDKVDHLELMVAKPKTPSKPKAKPKAASVDIPKGKGADKQESAQKAANE